jgi:hypothetical protein
MPPRRATWNELERAIGRKTTDELQAQARAEQKPIPEPTPKTKQQLHAEKMAQQRTRLELEGLLHLNKRQRRMYKQAMKVVSE